MECANVCLDFELWQSGLIHRPVNIIYLAVSSSVRASSLLLEANEAGKQRFKEPLFGTLPLFTAL